MIPIFIVGCERSGTTMLASILSRYTGVVAIPESQFLVKLPWNTENSINGQLLNRILKNDFRFKVWNLHIEFNEDKYYDPQSVLIILAKKYNRISTEKVDYIIDHTPSHVKNIIKLKKLFPNSKFIHLVRDGRAVYSSIRKLKDWSINTPNGVAKHWKDRVLYGIAAEKSDPKNVLSFTYEDFLENPNDTLDSLRSFIGIKELIRNPQNKNFVLPAYTRGQHNLVGKPLDQSRIDDWRNILTYRELSVFESQAGELLEHFGYMREINKIRELSTFQELCSFLMDLLWSIKSKFLISFRLRNSKNRPWGN